MIKSFITYYYCHYITDDLYCILPYVTLDAFLINVIVLRLRYVTKLVLW